MLGRQPVRPDRRPQRELVRDPAGISGSVTSWHHIFETALAPAHGHTGFHGKTVKGRLVKGRLPVGEYFHWLHHRYFEGNYGETTIPLDRWFGTYRDSPEAYEEAAARAGERRHDLAGEDPGGMARRECRRT